MFIHRITIKTRNSVTTSASLPPPQGIAANTRTAAAGMAMSRIRQLHPQFEG